MTEAFRHRRVAHLLTQIAGEVVQEIADEIPLGPSARHDVLSGVHDTLVQIAADGHIRIPGQEGPSAGWRGAVNVPLHDLATKLVQAAEKRGHIDWADWAPMHEGIAVTGVYGVLLKALKEKRISIPEQ